MDEGRGGRSLIPMMRVLMFVLLLTGKAMADPVAAKLSPLLEKYCVQCHGADKAKGGIELHTIRTEVEAFRSYRMLENAAHQLETKEMPPDDEKVLPDAETRAFMVKELRAVGGRLQKGEFPRQAGRPTIRRLNRNEYNNTMRDLFGVDFRPGKDFPADGAGGEGFDNVGDALFLPPVLMEKYIAAARSVVDAVYASEALKRRVIFVQPKPKTGPADAARQVLTFHASLAFRRRIAEEEIGPMLKLVEKVVARGDSFDEALRGPLQAMLIHPAFLFRSEDDPAGKDQWPVSGFELATRLSYFLWASMPDRALFQLADQGKLSDAAVLRAQVDRMLADPRAETLARHFAGQWLGFDDLRETAAPDPKRFPTFTPTLRIAMYRESTEFFNYVLQQNRPATELLDANYTFLNADLAAHYGIAGVTGAAMQKVSLTDRQRGGIIGQAAIMTVTSLPLRTSPVKRGKYILETLLGTPPPPPPQNAGVLPADDKTPDGLTFREQLERHRKVASCAGCHAKIDPLGFGLENFDAIGHWRTKDANGKPVDSKAELPGGGAFSTPAELKAQLMKSSDLFCRQLCRKLLAYALGRPLDYYDEPVIAALYETLKRSQYQLKPVIQAIVSSYPFQNRSAKR